METYKFETVMLKNGMIHIPEISKFENNQAEISTVIKQKKKKGEPTEKMMMKEFLEKWTGVVKDADPDDAKFGYLLEKYK